VDPRPRWVASRLVPIYLVRHAHAGKRSHWDGDDRDRPLSEKGRVQADWLTEHFSDIPVERVVSSPFLRCVQTVGGLAEKLGLEVTTHEAMAEGADPYDALEVLRELSPVGVVGCSHGDVIPRVLRALVADGMVVEGPLLDQKGSIWIIDGDDGRPTRGRYVPPGA
jgi:phosphohistidine phosphatase SixA